MKSDKGPCIKHTTPSLSKNENLCAGSVHYLLWLLQDFSGFSDSNFSSYSVFLREK